MSAGIQIAIVPFIAYVVSGFSVAMFAECEQIDVSFSFLRGVGVFEGQFHGGGSIHWI